MLLRVYSSYYPKVLIDSYIIALFAGLPLVALCELLINNRYRQNVKSINKLKNKVIFLLFQTIFKRQYKVAYNLGRKFVCRRAWDTPNR